MRDQRRVAWCWQSVGALGAIRSILEGKERTTALAIYLAMTEIANEQRAVDEPFRATRAAIAERAGVTKRTLDRYADIFEKLGLLEVVRRRLGDRNLPNEWALLEPPDVSLAAPPSGVGCTGVAQPTTGGGAANDTRSQAVPQEELQEGRAVSLDVAERVYAHYVAGKPDAKFKRPDPSARRYVEQALTAGFEEADLIAAVDGLLASDFHRQRGLQTFSVIFKTGPGTESFRDRIEGFIARAPKSPGGATPGWVDSAVRALRDKGTWDEDAQTWVSDNDAVSHAMAQVNEWLERLSLELRWTGPQQRVPIFVTASA